MTRARCERKNIDGAGDEKDARERRTETENVIAAKEERRGKNASKKKTNDTTQGVIRSEPESSLRNGNEGEAKSRVRSAQ